MKQAFSILTAISLVALPSQSMTYKVRKGDTLSQISKKFHEGPVYGKGGSLEIIAENNPHIANIHFILPGMKVKLSESRLRKNYQSSLSLSQRDIETPQVSHHTEPVLSETQLKRGLSSIINDDSITKKTHLDEPKITGDEQIDRYSHLSIQPQIGFMELNSTQSNGESSQALSEIGYGLSGSWNLAWTNNLSSSLYFDLMNYDFAVAASDTLDDSSLNQINFGANIGYQIKPWLLVNADVGFGSRLLLRSKTGPNSFTVDSIYAPYLSVAPEIRLLQVGTLSSSLLLGYSQFFSAKGLDQNYTGGFQYEIGLLFKQQRSWGEVFASFNFNQSSEKSDIIEADNSSVKFGVGLKWKLGADTINTKRDN